MAGKNYKRPSQLVNTGTAPPISPASSSAAWFPRLLGLSVFAGFALMRFYYFWGGVVVYIGLFFLLCEICTEPWILKKPLWLQVGFLAIFASVFGLITIGIFESQAPLGIQSYAMRNGEYTPGTNIEGIIWDSHFTDLRVAVTNPTDSDYENLNLAIQPDTWTYKAAIVTPDSGCQASPLGGNSVFSTIIKSSGPLSTTVTKVGTGLDAHDSQGNIYTPIANELGYGLRCPRLPAHFTVVVVFASVSVTSINRQAAPLKPNKHSMTLLEYAGPKTVFDLLDPRPSPSKVTVSGSYVRKLKPFNVVNTVKVDFGS